MLPAKATCEPREFARAAHDATTERPQTTEQQHGCEADDHGRHEAEPQRGDHQDQEGEARGDQGRRLERAAGRRVHLAGDGFLELALAVAGLHRPGGPRVGVEEFAAQPRLHLDGDPCRQFRQWDLQRDAHYRQDERKLDESPDAGVDVKQGEVFMSLL